MAVVEKTSPPRIQGEPILGNARQMGIFTIPWFIETYKKVGPIFRISALNQHYTVMIGVEANNILKNHGAEHFTNATFFELFNTEMRAEYTIVSLDGEEHQAMRRQLRPVFARSALNGQIQPLFDMAVSTFQSVKPGDVFPVVDTMQRLVTRQLGQALMGRDAGDYFEDLRLYLRRIIEVAVTKSRPKIALKGPRYQRAKARAFELGERLLAAYDADSDNAIHLDAALAMTDPYGEPLSHEERVSLILFPFFAGMDTVANTSSFMLYALARHPAVYQRVRDEVDATFGRGEMPGIRELGQLHALHGTAMETLRMWPIGGTTRRTVTTPFEFEGCYVEAGTNVLIANAATHFLPEFFPDPYTFDIDRYQKPRSEHRQTPGAYAPFTLGPHTCLGACVAEIQLGLILAAAVHTVGLELTPADYDINWELGAIPGAPADFKLRVTEHRS
ncbi:MAG: cytochrome P450 [Anaerolineae bacterium]